MKLFDCTTYFEEDMMMEIRFNILNQYVDKFVVCEANFSHSGSKKKINFNKDNFPKFKKKIIHIILKNEPKNLEKNINSDPSIARSNSIKRINFQRDYIIKGLNEARADDFIMYSDNDEIPDLSNVDFKNTRNKILIFKQKLFYYKFNLAYPKIDWFGTKACKFKDLQNIAWLRNVKNKRYNFFRLDTLFSKTRYKNVKIIDMGGWHFTNLKTPKELLKKYLNDEMHSEFEIKNDNLKDIENKIKNKFINYDHLIDTKSPNEKKQNNRFELTKTNLNILPNYIQDNLNKYKSWID